MQAAQPRRPPAARTGGWIPGPCSGVPAGLDTEPGQSGGRGLAPSAEQSATGDPYNWPN